MSAQHYQMSTAWDEQRVAPQLEQEYDFDSGMYGVVRHTPATQQGVGRGQQGGAQDIQNPTFGGFDTAFPQNVQFNFAMQHQGQSAHPAQGSQGYYHPMSGPSNSSQNQPQQFAQDGLYAGRAQPMRGQINAFQDPNAYPQYSQQGVDLRSGSSQAGYGSSPQTFPQTFSPELGIPSQPSAVVQHPYMRAADGQSDLYAGPGFKRLRTLDDAGYDYDQEDMSDRETGALPEMAKAKGGACERCKGLKVRCEFRPGSDVCKRCSNANHECKIPGRKKRRAPPKREHLLSQIREQTEKINKLMADLEAANRKVEEARARAADMPSPSQSATTDFSLISSGITSPDADSNIGESEAIGGIKTKADVMNWITKARESIEAFGGYINMGGPGATREMLAAEEDGSDREAPLDDSADEDYDIAVVEPDEDNEANASGEEGSVHTSRRFGSEPPVRKERLATIPNPEAPLGLIARLSLGPNNVRRRPSRSSVGGNNDADEDLGLANVNYFSASPSVERPPVQDHQTPHILRTGLISVVEVEKLFDIYWKYMNLSVSLLDPALYSPQQTYWRSPFLFTVICGIASRFYNERPELYQRAMEYARLAAGTTLIGGQKNVESVHAYILLSLYPVPARKWEDDRGWIYLGVAIRIATDLNLHYPNTAKPKDEMHAREMLNRTRAWLNCFNLDRSTGSQYGKSPIINNMDYVANHSHEWWNSSPYNMKGFDIQIAGYTAELSIVGQFRAKIHSDPNSATGFNKNINLAALAAETDDRLARLWGHWCNLLREHTDPSDVQSNFRSRLLGLAYSYARMSVLSFGFQYAFGKTSVGEDVHLLLRCLRAAFDVTSAILDNIDSPDHRIFLRHGPEAQSVFVTFACAFLLKLMQPRYSSYVSREQRLEIRDKVEKVADLLGSPEVAVDDRHGPKLYSSFLKSLLAAPVARVDRPPVLQKRSSAKSKSVSPTSQKQELHDEIVTAKMIQSTPVTPAPTRPSLSPPPSLAMHPIVGPAGTDSPEILPSLGMDINVPGVPDFFSPPLPFDSELLQSMTETGMWPDMAIPGFGWMGSYQQGNVEMRS